jgi:hypothetical protein
VEFQDGFVVEDLVYLHEVGVVGGIVVQYVLEPFELYAFPYQFHCLPLDLIRYFVYFPIADVGFQVAVLERDGKFEHHDVVDGFELCFEGQQEHFQDFLVGEGEEAPLAQTFDQGVDLDHWEVEFALLVEEVGQAIVQHHRDFEGGGQVERADAAVEW